MRIYTLLTCQVVINSTLRIATNVLPAISHHLCMIISSKSSCMMIKKTRLYLAIGCSRMHKHAIRHSRTRERGEPAIKDGIVACKLISNRNRWRIKAIHCLCHGSFISSDFRELLDKASNKTTHRSIIQLGTSRRGSITSKLLCHPFMFMRRISGILEQSLVGSIDLGAWRVGWVLEIVFLSCKSINLIRISGSRMNLWYVRKS